MPCRARSGKIPRKRGASFFFSVPKSGCRGMRSRSEGEAFFPHEGAVSFANARARRGISFFPKIEAKDLRNVNRI